MSVEAYWEVDGITGSMKAIVGPFANEDRREAWLQSLLGKLRILNENFGNEPDSPKVIRVNPLTLVKLDEAMIYKSWEPSQFIDRLGNVYSMDDAVLPV